MGRARAGTAVARRVRVLQARGRGDRAEARGGVPRAARAGAFRYGGFSRRGMSRGERTELGFEVEGAGRVSAILVRPAGARVLYVLAHGAGAGMRHSFLEAMTEALAAREIATLRYQFPYAEHGKR